MDFILILWSNNNSHIVFLEYFFDIILSITLFSPLYLDHKDIQLETVYSKKATDSNYGTFILHVNNITHIAAHLGINCIIIFLLLDQYGASVTPSEFIAI
jgi:hypothetical protein